MPLYHQDVLLHAEDESSIGSQFEVLVLHHVIHLHQLTNVCVYMWECAVGVCSGSVYVGVCM